MGGMKDRTQIMRRGVAESETLEDVPSALHLFGSSAMLESNVLKRVLRNLQGKSLMI
jgi:hypothetical protein